MCARWLSAVLSVSIVGSNLLACSSEGETVGAKPPRAGSSGAAGKSGAAGAAGVSGSGGAAGKSGAGGSAGQAGASVGGAAGQGGASGNGGNAGSFAAGAAGASAGSAGANAAGNGGGSGKAGGAGQSAGGSGGAAGQSAGGSGGAAGQSAGMGGQPAAGSAGQGTGGAGGQAPDPFTYLYQENGNFVRFQPDTDKFEQAGDYARDPARKLMPIDLHSWSIANFSVDKRMFTDFRLLDASNKVLYETHDLEGAVHAALAVSERDKERGNNHQAALARFRIAEGDYTVVFSLLAGSQGHPELIVWRQKPENLFAILVGGAPSEAYGDTIDGKGIVVNVGETITRTFHVTWVDEDNVIYKSNANGFDK